MSREMKLHLDWVTGMIVLVILALLALMLLDPHSMMVPTTPVELKSIEVKSVDGKIEATGTAISGEAVKIDDVAEMSVKTKSGRTFFIHGDR